MIRIPAGNGFTLIELLVVISIIGLLASVVFASVGSAREKARVARAQVELDQITKAIALLHTDTGLYPSKITESPCVQDPEIYLNSPGAGLSATDGGFPHWQGPYMNPVPLDPWGTNYYFDPDYNCGPNTLGCDGLSQYVRVVESFGPNRAQNYGNGDDIVRVLCK